MLSAHPFTTAYFLSHSPVQGPYFPRLARSRATRGSHSCHSTLHTTLERCEWQTAGPSCPGRGLLKVKYTFLSKHLNIQPVLQKLMLPGAFQLILAEAASNVLKYFNESKHSFRKIKHRVRTKLENSHLSASPPLTLPVVVESHGEGRQSGGGEEIVLENYTTENYTSWRPQKRSILSNN